MNFETLYEAHKNLVYNLALSYVQNTEDAQEITQDVFVGVYQSFHKFQNDSTVTTWIYRITINKSLDFIRSRNRKKRITQWTVSLFHKDRPENRYDQPVFDHPGVKLEQKESLARIFRAMNQLPPNQKTALILSKMEGKSQVEMAEIMNLSAKAIESLIHRAKKKLEEILSKSEG